MSEADSDESARMRARVQPGDAAAASELFALVYAELRRIAGGHFRGNLASHTLQPTALVHEAFVRLARQSPGSWNDREHFVAIAATAMRQIIVDHARKGGAAKRGGGAARVTLTGEVFAAPDAGPEPVDVLALNAALDRLAALSQRQARIVELQFFGGLTVEETARALQVSTSLVEKEWRRARAWIRKELAEEVA